MVSFQRTFSDFTTHFAPKKGFEKSGEMGTKVDLAYAFNFQGNSVARCDRISGTAHER